MRLFVTLTLYRSPNDRRPKEPVVVNVDRIQVLERHGNKGTRVQFNLNEPALICNETIEEILEYINAETPYNIRKIK